jgi:hypothetical protein
VADLLAKDKTGNLWLYRGGYTSKNGVVRGKLLAHPVLLSADFADAASILTPGDFDGEKASDGAFHPDVIKVYGDGGAHPKGEAWLYRGQSSDPTHPNQTDQLEAPLPTDTAIATGLDAYLARLSGSDFDADGSADILVLASQSDAATSGRPLYLLKKTPDATALDTSNRVAICGKDYGAYDIQKIFSLGDASPGAGTPLLAKEFKTYQVTGPRPYSITHVNIPADATSVKVTLTATNATADGNVYVETSGNNAPGSYGHFHFSRFKKGSKPVTSGSIPVQLGTGGTLSLLYVPDKGAKGASGATVEVIVNVTESNTQDTSHATYGQLANTLPGGTPVGAKTDVLVTRTDGTLWLYPGGCGKGYRLGTSTQWAQRADTSTTSSTVTQLGGVTPAAVGDDTSEAPLETEFLTSNPSDNAYEDALSTGGGADAWNAVSGSVPAITNAGSITLPFTIFNPDKTDDPNKERPTSIELWVRHRLDSASDWSAWELAASQAIAEDQTTGTIDWAFTDGDGQYEYYTSAVNEAESEGKTEADGSIFVDSSGTFASRAARFPAAYTNNPVFTVAYGSVPSVAADGTVTAVAKVELDERYKPLGGTFGDWTLAQTATGSFSTPFSVTGDADGTYEFYTIATDADGNVEDKTQEDGIVLADASVVLDRNLASTMTPLDTIYESGPVGVAYQVAKPADAAPVVSVELYYRYRTMTSSAWAAWTSYGQKAGADPFSFSFPSGPGYYQLYTLATDAAGNAEPAPGDKGKASTELDVSLFTSATFHPIPLARAVDTRTSKTPLVSRHKQTIKFTGLNGIPTGATAITGTLVVITGTSPSGNITIAPTITTTPTPTSTINFPTGEILAAGITVGLTTSGTADVIYWSSSTTASVNMVIDVSGYYANDLTGASYHPITPGRVVDTRLSLGATTLLGNQVKPLTVWGAAGVPANAVAVTGNLAVVSGSYSGHLTLGPSVTTSTVPSTVNFPAGDNRAVGVTVGLSSSGTLDILFVPNSGRSTDAMDFVFDVTGYFTADLSGAGFHAMAPTRLLDSRHGNGLTGSLVANTPASFQVAGRSPVPSGATAITGTVTVTGETHGWAIYVGPAPIASPPTSSLNFQIGDIRANGLTVGLGSDGKLSATYMSNTGATTDLVLDVTGYFQ